VCLPVPGSTSASHVSPNLSPSEFESFARALRGMCGLSLDPNQKESVERRLGLRWLELGLTSLSSYLLRLADDPLEQQFVFEAFTVKETYFFRQDYQLEAFSREVVPELLREDGHFKRLTVWSAGCSTGEEVYTLAIVLNESLALLGARIQVVGTDLCRSNIETALRGEYRASSFRAIPQDSLSRYVDAVDKTYRIREPLRRICHFQQGNLLSPADARSVGRVDAVFCRNVLIYMDEASRLRVLANIYERLLPGGFLFLGHTESLLTLRTPFEPVHLSNDLVYRRPRTSNHATFGET
jgi:chemotaxis protein methyltransferase CheR